MPEVLVSGVEIIFGSSCPCWRLYQVAIALLCFSMTELQNSEHLVQNALYFIRRR